MEGQTATGKGPVKGWLLLPETRGLEEGADSLPPRKRLRPPKRDEEAECLPYGLPERGGPEAAGSTRGEEEKKRDLPLPKDLDTARLEEIREERCTWATTSPKNLLIEEGGTRSGRYSEGLALSLRHRDGSVLEEALTAFRAHKGSTSRGRPTLLGKGR